MFNNVTYLQNKFDIILYFIILSSPNYYLDLLMAPTLKKIYLSSNVTMLSLFQTLPSLRVIPWLQLLPHF